MTSRIRRGAMVVALFAGAITTVSVIDAVPVSAAPTTFINFGINDTNNGSTKGGTVYIDAIWGSCGGNSPNGSGYDAAFNWSGPGNPVSLYTKPLGGVGGGAWPTQPTWVPSSSAAGCGGASLSVVRVEAYPGSIGTWDPWSGPVGSMHAQQMSAPWTFGVLPVPTVGVDGGFRITGQIHSQTPLMDNRLRIDMFQVQCYWPEVCPALKNSSLVPNFVGAFTATKSKGNQWSGSVGWPGRYQMYIYDCSTGWTGSNTCAGTTRSVLGFMDIANGSVPAIDLDASCFGMYTCKYLAGGIASTTGEFHPLNPTRLLDTRVPYSHPNGKVSRGDGALAHNVAGSPLQQWNEMKNHELKVTGVAGIPTSGVAAVLLNVTADFPPGAGWVSVYPRPPVPSYIDDVSALYDNQATFSNTKPATSNLNVVYGENVPNLVLARVGAGGTIRLWNANPGGAMNVIIDVAGWFDTGESSTTAPSSAGGLGFTAVTPSRLFSTRSSVEGEPDNRLSPGDTVKVKVRDLPDIGIPSNAQSVVINITAGSPTGKGYVSAYPSDAPTVPNVSNLNVNTGITRANLAVVKVGADDEIWLTVGSGNPAMDMNLFVDILGYYSQSGGDTTIINPTRVLDTRQGAGPIGANKTINVKVANTHGIPAGVKAVLLNVTAVGTTSGGYLTVYKKGVTQPNSSNINWPGAGRDTPNMVMVAVSTDGYITIFNERGTTGVLVDVFGYVT